ncbi:hypothetical protein MPSI1_003575 [Malassezia psittaci]|uniref:Peptidase M20 dimerisation domain-containing protein n=1 Tax=Malassezia psittaci TaxID=1821823 RepID=A0AAF0F7Y5_9BASI|nr:hypothetical protein MPSI1_003575 [Malassezia psittaci]
MTQESLPGQSAAESITPKLSRIGPVSCADNAAHPLHAATFDGTSILTVAVDQKTGLLFVGAQSGVIFVWDLVKQQLYAHLIGHTRSVLTLVVAEEEGCLFSASSDGTVRLWDIRKLEPLALIYPASDNTGDILNLAWCSSYHTLFLGCQDTSIQWITITADTLRQPFQNVPESRPHKFFDSMSRAAAGSSNTLPLAVRTAEQLIRCTSVRRINPMSNDESNLDSNGDSVHAPEQMSVLTVDKAHVIASAHFGYVYSLTFVATSDGVMLASGAGDETIRLWTMEQGTLQLQHTLALTKPTGDAILALAAWDHTLLAGKQGGAIDVWDLESRAVVRTLQGHTDDVLCFQISEPGVEHCFFSASADGYVCQWNGYFRCTARWHAHKDIVQTCMVYKGSESRRNSYSWLSSEPVFITGSSDGSVRLWPFESPAAIPRSPEQYRSHSSLVNRLARFIRYKSVSQGSKMPVNEENLEDSRQAAHFLKSTLMELGASDVQLVSGEMHSNPTVLGTFRSTQPARRRCLFYGHYDCIPASGEWDSYPWTLRGHNGYLYARGVSDNKGPVLAVACAASELVQTKQLDVDIVMLVEGEQETGSKNFASCLQAHKHLIGPIMVKLLATLTDADGCVTLEGFYTDVKQVSQEELAYYKTIVHQVQGSFPTPESLVALWQRPSLTVHRVSNSGPTHSTVIPNSVEASISIRIVPNQDLSQIEQLLRDGINRSFNALQSTNQFTLDVFHRADWWQRSPANTYWDVLAQAVEAEWGAKPIYIREGGSIPGIAILEKELSAPAVHLPMGQASDHAHLPNERIRLINLEKGQAVVRRFLQALSDTS